MYAPEIMKDQKTVKMLDSVRKLFDIEKFKNQYFSNIEFFYNSIVNLSDLELTVAASSPYHTFITTQKLANERPDLFKIKDDIHDVIYNSLNINTFTSKDILEKLLKTNTMEEVEAILIPILNFAFESKHSIRDALYESEIPENIKKIEIYLSNKKPLYIDPSNKYPTYSNSVSAYVVTDNSYEVSTSPHDFLSIIKNRLLLSWCSYNSVLGILYAKYLYPFLVEKYYKKEISNIDIDLVYYNSLLIKNNFIDLGDFSRHLVDLLISPDSSNKEEELVMRYSNVINFNLVDKSALKKIKPRFITKHSLQGVIYPVDPSLFIDELLACKNMKLRMLAVELLPKGDKRLTSLLSEKTYTLSQILIQKVPVENLPFMLGSFKGKHKNELEKMIAARMSEEEVIIEYTKRVSEQKDK
jgi:hypothetical protein